MKDRADAAARDRYAVAGHPVEHSRSPFIHARFAALTGEPIDYGRLPCPLDGFAATVGAFAASAGTGLGPARGCNVTVPFKFEAVALAAQLTPRAALAQAANTLRFDAGGWQADNTDGAGLVRDITVHAGVALRGATLLLVGAGGAAAGVLGPLLETGPQRLVLANRSPDRACTLVERHAALAALASIPHHVGRAAISVPPVAWWPGSARRRGVPRTAPSRARRAPHGTWSPAERP